MQPLISRLVPGATGMIRADHSNVLLAFHKFRGRQSPDMHRALVDGICRALDMHAQLEEEIFYPACRVAGIDNPVLERSLGDHVEMHRLIGELRHGDAASAAFELGFMSLMRAVMHHMADEETVLLPDAERVLGSDRLAELGLQMTRRRLELSRPQAGAIVRDTVRTARPASLMVAAGALMAGGYVVKRLLDQRAAGH